MVNQTDIHRHRLPLLYIPTLVTYSTDNGKSRPNHREDQCKPMLSTTETKPSNATYLPSNVKTQFPETSTINVDVTLVGFNSYSLFFS